MKQRILPIRLSLVLLLGLLPTAAWAAGNDYSESGGGISGGDTGESSGDLDNSENTKVST